jgi:hypothetical protein
MEDSKMAATPSPTTTDTDNQQRNTTNQIQDTDISKTNIDTSTTDIKISSSHPRFSTQEIIQNFPHIQHRFCHKIKVSIPWKNTDAIPNEDTYYKAICYFFNMVKSFDSQFQILTWNINDNDYNTISDANQIPTSHKELSSYLYNLHVSPSRIKTSMVVTSSFNLSQLVRKPAAENDNQSKLLRVFRKDKLWVQPTTIQTMGEIKLIGFLQFIHPYHTNLKQLCVAIQSIVETRDIVLEIYRPRAVNKDKSIMTAPEAITIGVPSDISVQIYKSLMEKWRDVVTGHYDVVIGENNVLKTGYFIPFANGLLTQKEKNDAICEHDDFVKNYTGIKLRRCTSIDERFELSHEETTRLGYTIKKDKQKRTTTLRRILNSWTEKKNNVPLIQFIEQYNTNTHILLVKSTNKERTNKKLNQLIEVMSDRSDFPTLCGNTDNRGANIDRFALSKSGRGYLNYLKTFKTAQTGDDSDDAINSGDNSGEKRKRPKPIMIETESKGQTKLPSDSPVYKKSSNAPSDDKTGSTIQSDKVPVSADDRNNKCQTTQPKSQLKKKVTFQQAVLSNSNQNSQTTENKIAKPNMTLLSKNQPKRDIVNYKKSNNTMSDLVHFVDVPNTTVTLSTMTSEDMICKQAPISNMITRLSDTQIKDITDAVSLKYDSVLQKMQQVHENQIKRQQVHEIQIRSMMNNQKLQDGKINNIKSSQEELRNEVHAKLDKKMNMQNSLLHSMFSMLQDIKDTKTDDMTQPTQHFSDVRSRTSLATTTPTVINHSQDPDISYSETESDQESDGNDGTMTAPTVQSTIDSSLIDMPNGHSQVVESVDHLPGTSKEDTSSLSPPNDDQCSAQCQHVNQIARDSEGDIRQVTLTSSIDPTTIVEEAGWNDVNDTSKKKIPMRHAIISPNKRQTRSTYKKGSPNYNHYDPAGTIHRKSKRLQNLKDHSKKTKLKSKESDPKT